ncbi:MAG TPA: ADOP family duplicated permease [Vicinamibacterales bacterium]|nr:ADOP family duplicated permease [Vicinamibacterales bacterium]
MTTTPTPTTRVARAIYRALLRVSPQALRGSYRADMIATFDELSADAARRGAVAVLALLAREVLDLTAARALWRDVGHLGPWRQAARSLARRPGFALAAVITLSLGVAMTTALFSVVDLVLIRPLPYPDAGRLVAVWEASPSTQQNTSLIAPVRLEEWNRMSQAFDGLAGTYTENVTDTSGTEPERLSGRRVTPRYFAVYGMPPLIGRTFTADEERYGGPGAVVISEGLWTRRFGRDPRALGRALRFGGVDFVIVGVVPAAFSTSSIDVWLPAQFAPGILLGREDRFLNGVGRLKPGVTPAQGAADLAGVEQQLARQFPKTDAGWAATVRDLKDVRVGDFRRALWLVFAAVLLLWLISVANVAGLVLVQVHRRARELAIRAALGASRPRIVAGVLREGSLMALAGGALGAALAAWFVRLIPQFFGTLPRITEIVLDRRALGFSAAASLVAALFFSLWPAIVATRGSLAASVHGGGRGTAGGRHRLQRTLVVAQVALSVLLAGSAALLIRSYYRLSHVDPGFDPSGVVTFHVGARWDEDRTRVGQLQEQLVAALEALPHVTSAGLTNFLPATGATLRFQVSVAGLHGTEANGAMPVGWRTIDFDYLRTLRVPLVAGEWCPAMGPDGNAPIRVMVNQRFVQLYGQGQNLIGRELRFAQGANQPNTIVGVVGDVAEDGPGAPPMPYLYACLPAGAWPDPEYVARTSDPRAFAADLRRIVRELDAARAVFGVRPLDSVVDAALDQPRLNAEVLGLFAASAALLAAVGLYGLFMLLVGESTREIAVRFALGAERGQIVGLVAAGAGRLLAIGLGLGVAMTLAGGQFLRALLFDVSPIDLPAIVTAVLGLAVVAAGAIAIPALRATKVAPVAAIRTE